MKLSDIFTFLKESKLFTTIKEKVVKLLYSKKDELVDVIEEYINEKSDTVKEKAINFIMEHIELKFPYKFFKGSIRKVLDKNFDKLVDFILAKLQEI